MKHYLKIAAVALTMCAVTFVSCGKDDEVTTCTVTFDADGGSPVPSAQSVEAGKTATVPATNPVKTGYVFLFWHLNGASTAYNFSIPVNGNITLQAKWEEEAKVEYWQVSWELNGGAWPTSGDNHATQVAKGGTLAEPTAPIKTGKIFDGWYKEAALTNKINFPYDINSVTSNFTLYAKWSDPSAEYWQITWELNGGTWPSTGDNHVTKIEKGSKLAEPAAPVKSGNTFDGWYKEAAFTNKITFPATVTGDFTLYAKWTTGENKVGFYIGNTHYEDFYDAFNAAEGTTSTIIAYSNGFIGSVRTLSENTHITVEGGGSGERIFETGSGGGSFFKIESGASLTLKNIILEKTKSSIIRIEGGTFTMLDGTIIRESFYNNGRGGGVFMSSGNFIMKGGYITENSTPAISYELIRVAQGGGVLMTDGTFTMEGGEITKNTAEYVGGLYVSGGKFIMKGGRIHSNTSISTGSHPNFTCISPGTAVYGDGTPIPEDDGNGIIGRN